MPENYYKDLIAEVLRYIETAKFMLGDVMQDYFDKQDDPDVLRYEARRYGIYADAALEFIHRADLLLKGEHNERT